MIRRMRASRAVRAALCAAALCAVAAGFGLHPEPADGSGSPAATWAAAAADLGSPAHGCMACLNAGTALVASAAALEIPSLLAPAARPPRPALRPAPDPRERNGRDPPAAAAL